MKINTVRHFVVDAFKSLRRNVTISFASVITVAATLFIFGVFLLIMSNANQMMNSVQSKIEIKVFLDDNITITDQRNVEIALKENDQVRDVTYQSKQDAFKIVQEMLGDKNKDVLSGYDEKNNPFPAAFVVTLKEPQYSDSVTDKVKSMKGVDEVGNDRDLISSVIAVSKAVRWVGLGILALLMGVSLFLIVNTIRLTVFSRRREIGIMKFVGATDWFIRWPFIIEGMVIGIIGAIISNLGLYALYNYAVNSIRDTFLMVQMVSPSYVTSTILWQFMVAGSLIGAVGSIIALRKFLSV